jgi:hypothetical protein
MNLSRAAPLFLWLIPVLLFAQSKFVDHGQGGTGESEFLWGILTSWVAAACSWGLMDLIPRKSLRIALRIGLIIAAPFFAWVMGQGLEAALGPLLPEPYPAP